MDRIETGLSDDQKLRAQKDFSDAIRGQDFDKACGVAKALGVKPLEIKEALEETMRMNEIQSSFQPRPFIDPRLGAVLAGTGSASLFMLIDGLHKMLSVVPPKAGSWIGSAIGLGFTAAWGAYLIPKAERKKRRDRDALDYRLQLLSAVHEWWCDCMTERGMPLSKKPEEPPGARIVE